MSLPIDQAVVIQRVDTGLPYVAITVDDFYNSASAVRLLQAANAMGAALTLCPAGGALANYEYSSPEQAALMKQLVAAGSYELCNHTFSHPFMPQLGQQAGLSAEIQELLLGAEAISNFFGRPPSPFVRPPFGLWDVSMQQAAAQAGYSHLIMWSVDSGDTVGPEQSAQQLVANVAHAQAGDIILMHANRSSSAEALPLIVALLRQKGLEPATIPTLLASGQPIYATQPIGP